ncbi:MAG: hypothetical protein KDB92_02550 [Chitinophagaceae bacterium]|nr:hypothetical protein [Chitinophagaceae bacterium]
MKNLIALFVLSSVFFMACQNNDAGKNTEATAGDSTATDSSMIKAAIQDVGRQQEKLNQMTPLPPEELKTMLPDSLLGVAKQNENASNANGAAFASADYILSDTTMVAVGIYDCAGPAGAGIYSLQFLSLLNRDQENEEEFTKTIDYNGNKAFAHCDKETNDCTFSFFAAGRYLVTLNGEKINADILRQAANTMNFK